MNDARKLHYEITQHGLHSVVAEAAESGSIRGLVPIILRALSLLASVEESGDELVKRLQQPVSTGRDGYLQANFERREAAARLVAQAEEIKRKDAALENIENGLRKAGATLPAPVVTGTIEGAMNGGLCIALCLVVNERERAAQTKERKSSQ